MSEKALSMTESILSPDTPNEITHHSSDGIWRITEIERKDGGALVTLSVTLEEFHTKDGIRIDSHGTSHTVFLSKGDLEQLSILLNCDNITFGP